MRILRCQSATSSLLSGRIFGARRSAPSLVSSARTTGFFRTVRPSSSLTQLLERVLRSITQLGLWVKAKEFGYWPNWIRRCPDYRWRIERRFSDPGSTRIGLGKSSKRRTVVEKPYHIIGKEESQELAKFLVKNGQALLPMVELIEQSKLAVDELIDVLGRAQIEAVLRLSAERIAGPPHPGKKGGAIGWHGGEEGRVCLKERKLRVRRPRLRKKGQGEEGEVPIPAYETMHQDGKLGSRMLEILLRGVSTRQYRAVLPEMAETVGVSRSSVSREAIEASEEELQRLCERRLDAVNLLVIYLDGIIFGDHHVLVAIGVDEEGKKHVLGLAEGASENQVVAKGLLEDMVRRGVKLDRKYLFVIDGSKALRAAIDAVVGAKRPVERCGRSE